MSVHKIVLPPHCHHSCRLKSDIVTKHKKDSHMCHGVGGDILEFGEFGKSSVEDEVVKEDVEDVFACSAEGINPKDPWGKAMESIIQV